MKRFLLVGKLNGKVLRHRVKARVKDCAISQALNTWPLGTHFITVMEG